MKCPKCEGKGFANTTIKWHRDISTCSLCLGKGEIFLSHACKKCGGEGEENMNVGEHHIKVTCDRCKGSKKEGKN
jgi:DnaJ-class molecular chaperone